MRRLHTTFGAAVFALCAVAAVGGAGCGGLGPPRDAQVSGDPDAGPPAPPPGNEDGGGRPDAAGSDRLPPDLGVPARDTGPARDLGGPPDRPPVDAPADMPRRNDVAAPADLRPGADAPIPEDTATPPPDRPPGGSDAVMCVGPIPACVPQGIPGECDPVCQIGCACDERCRAANGTTTCEPGPENPIAVGDECNTGNDECRGGAICLPEFQSICGAHCYRMCDSDMDCMGGSRCTLEIESFGGPGAKACSPPPHRCDPTGQAPCGRADRPSPAFACYPLALDHADETVCDCAGDAELGAACTMDHECRPGLECVESAGGRACRQLCRLSGEPPPCPGGQTCTPFNSAGTPTIRYGYCL